MALTITYDGYGVVANADAEVNDTGGSGTGDWKELGGGTIGLNPDVPYYGVASMGSKYASKTGYSYIDGITALDFSGGGAQEGEMIYSWLNIQSKGALASLATNGLAVMHGSSTANSNEWKIAGVNDANGWTGGWKLFVIDPTIVAGTVVNGTTDLSSINTLGIWVDTDVSVRADSIFQSQILCAKGLKFTGTPTITGGALDEIVDWATDLINRAAGMFQKRGSTYFSLGSLTIGDGTITTVFDVSGSNLEYEESSYWNGSAWVSSMPTDANSIVTTANASIDAVNFNVSGFIDNKLGLDVSLGNASSFKGGTLKLLRTLLVKSTDIFNGTIFSTNDALNLGSASYDNCTFNICATQTISATTTSFTNNTFNPATGITSLSTSSLAYPVDCTFNSTGTGHAITLGTIAATSSVTWDNTESGYVTGTTGSPITTGTSGNETILCSVASGQVLTINVSSTASTPSVKNDGLGTVNVVAGQTTISFTLNPSITGYEWRMYNVTALGSLTGSVELDGEEVAIADNQAYSYTYTIDKPFAIQILSGPYEEEVTYLTQGNTDQDIIINLTVDNND